MTHPTEETVDERTELHTNTIEVNEINLTAISTAGEQR